MISYSLWSEPFQKSVHVGRRSFSLVIHKIHFQRKLSKVIQELENQSKIAILILEAVYTVFGVMR